MHVPLQHPVIQVKRLQHELHATRMAFICAMNELLDLKDIATGVHSTRLAEWAVRVGERLGLDGAQLDAIEQAALLHDIGKVGVPDAILSKPAALTPSELQQMQKHAEYGWAVLRRIPGFETASLLVLHHHERLDGKGYPAGLSGDAIPLGSRIVAIIDAFDAMTSHRPYRADIPLDEAIRRLVAGAGTQFDPHILTEFLAIVRSDLPAVAAICEPVSLASPAVASPAALGRTPSIFSRTPDSL